MQVEIFPLTSVTVSVTVFAPTLAQVNEEGETAREAIPQASELPLLIWAAVIVAVPTPTVVIIPFATVATSVSDDAQSNVDAASAVGLHGVWVEEDPTSAVRTLRSLAGL